MKRYLILPILALAIAACTNDGPTPSVEPSPSDESVERFLSVSIVTPTITRAGYIDGEPEENNINSIRFYFFDASGNPVNVSKQSASNKFSPYIDWYSSDGSQSNGSDPSTTVEKIVSLTLGLNQPTGQEPPSLVLAVINPPISLIRATQNLTLDELRKIVEDYHTGLTSNNFVITNSVYRSSEDTDGEEITATPILPENYGSNENSEMTPLVIYVERVLARLDFSLNLTDEEGNALVGKSVSYNGENFTIFPVESVSIGQSETQVYARFLGWNIVQTPNRSRLVKKINPQWSNSLFGNLEPWNSTSFKRSFWAINPPAEEFTYLYGTFNDNTPGNNGNYATANPMPVNGGSNVVTRYMQENAAYEDDGEGAINPTELIIAAQLVNADGSPLTLAYWTNRYYTTEGLINAITTSLKPYLYKKVATNAGTSYKSIVPEDLQLMSAMELFNVSTPDQLPEGVLAHFTYIQLTETAQGYEWYNGDLPTSTALTYQQVNTFILDIINEIKLWQSGNTYYYVDIRHLGGEGYPGYFGVVRNHIYDTTITKIIGLGTPVFNPNEVIYPEKTTDNDNIIDVVVKLLQWRIVSQDYTVTWP